MHLHGLQVAPHTVEHEAEIAQLRADNAAMVRVAADCARHLRQALEEMAVVVAMSGESSPSRVAKARVVDVVRLLDRVQP